MPTDRSRRKAAAADSNEAENDTNEEEQSLIDDQGPASILRSTCTGFLSKRLEMWVERFPDILDEMGLGTWQELRPYAHEEPKEIGESFRALVEAKAGGDKQLLMSAPNATQLGRVISEMARSNTETISPPRSMAKSAGTGLSGSSGKTESELTRDTAKLAIYSSMKNDIKLEMANGEHKPAHVADVLDYAGETAKLFVGMDGYAELKGAVQARRDAPGLSLEEMLASHPIPDDLRVQFARQLYAGLSPKYKREVLQRSSSAKREQAAEKMYEDGIVLTHVLIATSLDLSELEIATRRVQYLSVTAVPSNNKAGLTRAFEKYKRETVELYQLQDLGSIRKTAAKTMYDAGTILLTQYCDIAQTWSNLWQGRPKDESMGDIRVQHMKYLQTMVIDIEQRIRDLPDVKYTRTPMHEKGPLMTGQGAQAGGTADLQVCRQFRRNGTCTYGAKCKFVHEQPQSGKVMMVNPVTEGKIEHLQSVMMSIPQSVFDEAGEEEFQVSYDAGCEQLDNDEFHKDIQHMQFCLNAIIDGTLEEGEWDDS